MNKIKCDILITTMCVGLLAGCVRTNKETDNVSSDTSESDSLVEINEDELENISESDKTEMLSYASLAELIWFDECEFDTVSELDACKAIYFSHLRESVSEKSGLYEKYGVDDSSDVLELPVALVEEMLLKYFGCRDVRSYSLKSDYAVDVSSLDDGKVFVDNFGFGGGGRELVLDTISCGNGVYGLVVDKVDDNGSFVGKQEYGLSKNDDGSYCLRYRRIVR